MHARGRLGRIGEDLAAEHLARLGYEVLARNVRTAAGEIDLIARRDSTLVFAEVKTRRRRKAAASGPTTQAEPPLAALRARQCSRLRRAAVAWLSQARGQRPRARVLRFDAVGVVVDERNRLLRLDHLEGAF